MKIRFIDLFAGIGGFRYGLERANDVSARQLQPQSGRYNDKKTSPKKHSSSLTSKRGKNPSKFRCVYSNEWDKYASQIYKKHFGECDTRDIRTVKSSEIPDFDLLVGGFPCQAFSIAGKRKGFDDTRGTLFFEIARILADKRPRYFLLENVKGLLSHDEGKTFQTILGVLTDLGYEFEWQVLNSKNFGVPQNRERVFIVGYTRGESRPKVFPIREDDGISIKRQGKVSPSDIGGRKAHTTSPMRWVRTEKGKAYRREAQRKGRDLTPFNEGYRELVEAKEQVSGCITNAIQKDALLKQDMKIRRLTPIECERLQGFPDGWTEFGINEKGEQVGISDTQRYKVLGNAITTNVVVEISKRLLNSI